MGDIMGTGAAAQAQALAYSSQVQAGAQTNIAQYQMQYLMQQSDNQKQMNSENNATQRFQMMTWLTSQQDSLDAKLEIAKSNASVAIAQETNRHEEADAKIKNDGHELDIRAMEINQASNSGNFGNMYS